MTTAREFYWVVVVSEYSQSYYATIFPYSERELNPERGYAPVQAFVKVDDAWRAAKMLNEVVRR